VTVRKHSKKKTMKTKTQNTSVSHKNSSELQSRSEQLGSDKNQNTNTPKLISVDFELRRANRTLPTEKVLNLLQDEAPSFFGLAEVVGKWVWIQFKEKQPREVTSILSQLGFHWNNKRQAWQHPCGEFRKAPASYDPRQRYGSSFPADAKPA
jgi:hypothetical protein